MSVVIETTIGDLTVDLYQKERPNTCLNFLKLCKMKYYNLCLFHKIEKNFIAQAGDPTGTGRGGESVFCHLYGEQAKYFDSEFKPRLKHEKLGCISMVNNGNNMNGSQFFFTLGENLTYLDEVHTVFGEVVEGFTTLLKLNEAICDENNRPYQDIRITHTVILHDPYDDPQALVIPDASPEPSREQLESGYIAADEEIDNTKGKTSEEIEEKIKENEAKARATILEMVGDIPDADVKPPENVLFVCKLNPVTTSEDLEVIFSRFGKIISCEVIKDQKTKESLQYAFIEFEKEEDCENAYFKMDNVLIDDRRIHVDFSQSVSKLNWKKDSKISVKASKSNFVLKKSSKKSDNYDLIFDVKSPEDKAFENRKVKHNLSRSKTPQESRSKSFNYSKYTNRSRSRSPPSKKKHKSHDSSTYDFKQSHNYKYLDERKVKQRRKRSRSKTPQPSRSKSFNYSKHSNRSRSRSPASKQKHKSHDSSTYDFKKSHNYKYLDERKVDKSTGSHIRETSYTLHSSKNVKENHKKKSHYKKASDKSAVSSSLSSSSSSNSSSSSESISSSESSDDKSRKKYQSKKRSHSNFVDKKKRHNNKKRH